MKLSCHFKTIALFGALLASLLMGLPTAHAARLALVVGNDAYTHVSKLQNARNDARLMAATLKDAGFEVSYAENADRNTLWRVVESLGKRINKGDEVVFFFAGHGVQIGSNPVLLPTDIKAESDRQVERDGVPLFDIQDALKAARVSLLIIDACRDNPFPKVGTRTVGGSRGLAPPDPAEGQAIIMSAGRNQKALDTTPGVSANNGLFTHEFVRIIKENGLDVRTALVKVRDSVDDKARSASHEQRPSVIDDLRGNFYFFAPVTIVVQAPPAVVKPPEPIKLSTRIQAADEIEQQAWEDVQKMDSLAAYELYLAEYPQGRFVSRAKIKVAGFKAINAAAIVPAPAPVIAPTAPVYLPPVYLPPVYTPPVYVPPAQAAAPAFTPPPPVVAQQAVSAPPVVSAYAKAKALPNNVGIKEYLNALKELRPEQIAVVDKFQRVISTWPHASAIAAGFDGAKELYIRSGHRFISSYLANTTVIQRCQEKPLKSPCTVIFENGRFSKLAFQQIFDVHFNGQMSDPAGLVDNFIDIMPQFTPDLTTR